MTRISKLGTKRTTALELELPIKPQKDHLHLLALFLLARHDRKDDGANRELSTMLLLVGRDLHGVRRLSDRVVLMYGHWAEADMRFQKTRRATERE